jgi:purine-binding chemotaxis protein CheW
MTNAQFLSFVIGAEEYGLEILQSREVLQYPAVTAVPSMSSSVRGVINLRGTAVPVVDLAVVFGKPAQEITKRTCVVVVAIEPQPGEHGLLGLVVESVHQVFELRGEDIEPAPALGHRGRKFIRGLGRLGGGFVLLLDLPRVLEHIDLDEPLEDIPLPDAEPELDHEITIEHHDFEPPPPEEKESSQP